MHASLATSSNHVSKLWINELLNYVSNTMKSSIIEPSESPLAYAALGAHSVRSTLATNSQEQHFPYRLTKAWSSVCEHSRTVIFPPHCNGCLMSLT